MPRKYKKKKGIPLEKKQFRFFHGRIDEETEWLVTHVMRPGRVLILPGGIRIVSNIACSLRMVLPKGREVKTKRAEKIERGRTGQYELNYESQAIQEESPFIRCGGDVE